MNKINQHISEVSEKKLGELSAEMTKVQKLTKSFQSLADEFIRIFKMSIGEFTETSTGEYIINRLNGDLLMIYQIDSFPIFDTDVEEKEEYFDSPYDDKTTVEIYPHQSQLEMTIRVKTPLSDKWGEFISFNLKYDGSGNYKNIKLDYEEEDELFKNNLIFDCTDFNWENLLGGNNNSAQILDVRIHLLKTMLNIIYQLLLNQHDDHLIKWSSIAFGNIVGYYFDDQRTPNNYNKCHPPIDPDDWMAVAELRRYKFYHTDAIKLIVALIKEAHPIIEVWNLNKSYHKRILLNMIEDARFLGLHEEQLILSGFTSHIEDPEDKWTL